MNLELTSCPSDGEAFKVHFSSNILLEFHPQYLLSDFEFICKNQKRKCRTGDEASSVKSGGVGSVKRFHVNRRAVLALPERCRRPGDGYSMARTVGPVEKRFGIGMPGRIRIGPGSRVEVGKIHPKATRRNCR